MDLLTISPREYERRFEGARAGMKKQGLEALLVGTGVNLQYFSGFPSPAQSGSRPFFLLLPQASDPVLIVHTGRQREAERFTWVRDIRTYEGLGHVPEDLLVDVIRERDLETGTMGLEWGHEMRSDLPIWELLQLAARFSALKLVDGSPVIWQQRLIKSEPEIARVRHACTITSKAYGNLFGQVHEGMTEEEVFRRLVTLQADAGSGSTWSVMTSGPGNYELASKPPSARCLVKGDMLWLDAGCSVGGYWSDFSRAGVLGEPIDTQRRYQEQINQITTATVAMIRPGIEVGSVETFCNRLLEQSGLQWTQSISGSANRIGHGLGMNVTEPPSVASYDHTVIRAGMILTVEPGIGTEHGIYHHEQNVLVLPDGVELLSTASTELAAIH